MSDYQFSAELDTCLRGFIARPGNFIADISFVHSLFVYPLVGIAEQFVLPIEEKTVIPVFTTAEALAMFEKRITDDLTFENKSFVSVVNDLLSQEFDAIAFNLQPAGQDASNATMLPREHLLTFINRYTDVLNKLSENESESKANADKYFLIPAFVKAGADGEVSRLFATLAKPDGESLVPVFSTISSFAKWYNDPEFGIPFQENNGRVLTWSLSELTHPSMGKNELADVAGIAIDPFEMRDYDASIVLWQDLSSSHPPI